MGKRSVPTKDAAVLSVRQTLCRLFDMSPCGLLERNESSVKTTNCDAGPQTSFPLLLFASNTSEYKQKVISGCKTIASS
jgi:hypothetical protein